MEIYMDSNFWNVDEKINLIYNFIYDKIDVSCFDTLKIKINEIKLDDIKIGIKHKDIVEDIFKYLKKGNFQMSTHDEKTKTTVLKRFSDSFTFNLIIEAYDKNKDDDTLKGNRDSLFSYLLSELVIKRKTSHILLPIVKYFL